MLMKVKICGLMRDEDVEAVNNYVPDFIGFVFAGEKRRLTCEQALKLRERLDKKITVVGVFVNADPKDIIMLCEKKVIDVVQLHGDEDAEYILELKKHVRNKIIKAVRVKDCGQVIEAAELPADYFLFDSYVENMYGGSGKRLDYRVLSEAFNMLEKNNLDYFLAGGINLGNIDEVINSIDKFKYKPLCLDISSGVETDGWKDAEKIREVISKIVTVYKMKGNEINDKWKIW